MLENQTEICDDVIVRTRDCEEGFASLRDEHENILSHLKVKGKQSSENGVKGIKERVKEVTETLELLEVGVEESNIITTLAEHFDNIESDQSMIKLDIMRVKDENDWLREELEDVEKRMEDTLVHLAGLEEEKKHWLFMEEVCLNH
jgi:chromosome segregation ATPase